MLAEGGAGDDAARGKWRRDQAFDVPGPRSGVPHRQLALAFITTGRGLGTAKSTKSGTGRSLWTPGEAWRGLEAAGGSLEAWMVKTTEARC